MRTPSIIRPSRASLLATLVLVSACADDPVAPALGPDPGNLTAEYECTVDVEAATTSCQLTSTQSGVDGAKLDLILGSPYVSILSSGMVSSRGNPVNEDTTTVNMSVKSSTPQPIGTTDGITAHPSGSRMLFSSGPTVTAVNTGTVAGSAIRVDNADGTATFTNPEGTLTYSNRSFFQYNGILISNATSASKPVRFIFTSNVKTFSYGLRVSAPVQYQYGWITISPATAPVLEPGGTTMLTGTVYNHVGQVQADGISWVSSDQAVATVNASTGQVTAVGEGTATITATSTVNAQRTGTRIVSVDAAPSVSSTTPTHGATGVAATDDIVITFSEPVNVSAASFALECPIGSSRAFTVSGSGTSTITLNPDSGLPAATACTVTAVSAQVSDVDTNDGPNAMAADYVFGFESVIQAIDDVFTETIVTGINTANTSPAFSVTANDQIDASTTVVFAGWDGIAGVTQQGGDVVMTTSGAGMGQFTYEPPAGYAGTDSLEYTVQSGSATSTARVALTIDAVPVVTGSTPEDAATDVAGDIAIEITFSEPVSVFVSSFLVVCSSGDQDFTVDGSGSSTVTLHPDVYLPAQETCTVTVVAAQVSDADANGPNHLAEDYAFTFDVGFTIDP
jgi:uncharacterized protein YjdB